MRIGHGYDVHRFEPGRALVLGGVLIDFPLGLKGHSDADVLIHAVIDALLGAAALGDIGSLFPDTDQQYKNIDSRKLLAETAQRVYRAGYRVENIDCTVIAQRPKLREYIEEMRRQIALCLATGPERISIKATTEEGLGFTGRMEGISAHAVSLLSEREQGLNG